MAVLGATSIIIFFIAIVVVINPRWLSRGKFHLARKHGLIVLLLSFVGFVCAVALDGPTGSVSTTSNVQSEEQPKIQIEDSTIKRVIDDVKQRDFVKDAAITVDKNKASLAVIVDYTVNKETAKRIGDNFVRTLGSAAGGKFPEKDYYGEVYDYYDLIITVATPDETIISTGAKVTNAPSIKWDS
ncbi:hypothetical protein [Brevibacillus laterosporus]|uniref:hypothetical protein n=1 Tax=Brevibacillus laterosporus TaxID=1465 RepID=UPI0018CE87E0|nr:hypothetical protein [Brevibacillus laterosporus]MBG9788748.1 hypothetical protein [Brevibacillus laterosporus]